MNRMVTSLTALALTIPGIAAAEGPLSDGPAVSVSAVAKPSAVGAGFSNRIGMSTESYGGWLTLGYDRSGRHMNGENTTQQTINLGVGGRYLFSAPEKTTAAPYVYAQALTNRASADTGADFRDDLASDLKRYSLFAGFGGEVAVTQALSLSAELGLRHDVMDYDENKIRFMTIHTYVDTGILVNVYF